MAHYAKVTNGIVVEVITAEAEFIKTKVDTAPGQWIQTSYNTYGGVHANGGTPLRKNYAGIGYTYDPVRDAFIPPKPYASWILNEQSCLWEAPVVKPEGLMVWNESEGIWEEPTIPAPGPNTPAPTTE